MAWTTPIHDRTPIDVQNKTTKGYYNVSDFNRLEGNCAYLSDKFGLWLTTKAWDSTTLPTNADMQRILNNVQAIKNAYYVYPDCPQLPTHPVNNYTKANSIERILKDIEEIKRLNDLDLAYCGEIYCGELGGI